jgi:hypothetical protein
MKKMTKTLLASALLAGATIPAITAASDVYAAPKNTIVQVTEQEKHKQIIQNSFKRAKEGKTINSENFGIHSKEADIRKKWGKPTSSNDTFLSYAAKKQTEFGLHKGIVTWVNSSDKKLKEVTYEEIIKTAGTPVSDTKNEGRRYVVYFTGKYKLSFIFDGYKKTEKVLIVFVHQNK